MTTYKQIKKIIASQLQEDTPTNTAGAGAVAGIGVGAQGEPPGPVAKIMKMIKRRRPSANVVN